MLRTRLLTCVTAVFVLSCASPLLAGPFHYDAREAKQTVRLYGVVYRPDGRPLGKGAFSLRTSYDEFEDLHTDSKGKYSCKVRVKDSLLAEACAEGVGYSKILSSSVAPGAKTVVLEVPLKPIPVMTGIVSLPDGSPAANVALQAGGEMERDLFYIGSGAGSTGGNKMLALRTDGFGRYRVALLPDRPQGLDIVGDGAEYHLYLTSPQGWAGPVDVAVRLDQPEVVRDIHLLAGERVRGTVIGYPEAKPLAGVEVLAVRWSGMHGIQDLGRTTSDHEGRFEIPTILPAGEYDIWARGQGLFVVGSKGQPPTTTTDNSVVNVTINMTRPLRVAGAIYGPHGEPASGAGIENWRRRTDSKGQYVYQYERRPMDGMYGTPLYCPRYVTLAPRVKGFGVAAPAVVDVLSPWPDRLDFHLQKPGSISGKVVGEDGKCPPGVYPDLVPLLAHPGGEEWRRDMFYDADASRRDPGEDGVFSFVGVIPGDYRLEVKSAVIHELTVADGGAPAYTVTAGEALGPLTIAVTEKPRFCGELLGLPEKQLIEGSWWPVEAVCALRPSDGRDPPRRARFRDEMNNRYLAWSSVYGAGSFDIVCVAGRGPERWVSQIMRGVDLAEGAPTGPLDFTFTPGGSISGRLLAAGSGDGIPYQQVRIQPVRGDALMLTAGSDWGGPYEVNFIYASTDEQGRFSVSGLLPGEYEVTASWSPLHYGDHQSKTVSLSQDEQVADVTFQAATSWP